MDSRFDRERARKNRIELVLHDHVSAREYRELGALVRYCVDRIERELDDPECWDVKIVPTGDEVQSASNGLDGALAAWDALCSLEQTLREARARRRTRRPAARFDHR